MRTAALVLLLAACAAPTRVYRMDGNAPGEVLAGVDWMHVFGSGIAGRPTIAMKLFYVGQAGPPARVLLVFTSGSSKCWEFDGTTTVAFTVDGAKRPRSRARHEKTNINFVNWSYIFPGAVAMACGEQLTVDLEPRAALELASAGTVVVELGRYTFELEEQHTEAMHRFADVLRGDLAATAAR